MRLSGRINLWSVVCGAVALSAASVWTTASADAQTKLRLSTTGQPQSEEVAYAKQFAEEVEKRTEGRVQIRVYEASALGNWQDVEEYVMQGAVEMALQPLGARFGKAGALNNFPFITENYAQIKEAYSKGGFVYRIVDEALGQRGIKLLSVFGLATGGAGFSKQIAEPKKIVAKRNTKIRVWPGGRVHGVMMEKFGYQTTPLPWSDVYTGLQTGIIEGWIGSNPISAYEALPELTKMWVHYNAYFDALWMFVNAEKLASLDAKDRAVIGEVSDQLARQRIDRAEQAEKDVFEKLRQQGTTVVLFTDEERAELAKFVRAEVWPEIADEIGPDLFQKVKENLNLK